MSHCTVVSENVFTAGENGYDIKNGQNTSIEIEINYFIMLWKMNTWEFAWYVNRPAVNPFIHTCVKLYDIWKLTLFIQAYN